MPKVKESRNCEYCGKLYYRSNGNTGAKYCSRLCACRCRNTKEHQRKAGKAGGATKIKIRGTGQKHAYVKYYGRHMHRVVMEKHLGRKLKSNEIVHHIDGNTKNNSLKNLRLVSRSEHARIHWHEK